MSEHFLKQAENALKKKMNLENQLQAPEGKPGGISRRGFLKYVKYGMAAYAAAEGIRLGSNAIGVGNLPEQFLPSLAYHGIKSRLGNSPNIVLLSIDTLRADYFSPEHMPLTYEWAEDNCQIFTNAHANATWTLPSHVTMLTGFLPNEHGVETVIDLIPETGGMIQERLNKEGYHTVAFTGGGFVGKHFGFSRGFDRWYETEENVDCPLKQVNEFLASLRPSSKPTFLFIHTFYVHGYIDKDSPATKEKYTFQVKSFDEKLSDLIKNIFRSPLSRNLRMIVTSDHGEGFSEKYPLYGREFVSLEHGDWPCPSQVEIPFVVYDGQNKGLIDDLTGLDSINAILTSWSKNDVRQKVVSSSEREVLVSESIPLLGTRGGARKVLGKGKDIQKRGVAIIDSRGEYVRHWLEESVQQRSIELPDDVQKKLKGLGYLSRTDFLKLLFAHA